LVIIIRAFIKLFPVCAFLQFIEGATGSDCKDK